MKKFAATLSNAQFEKARAFERAGLTTLSQAVKAYERGDAAQIAAWKQALEAKKATG